MVLSIQIAATPQTVWRLLVEPEGLAQWWGTAQVDLQVGGIYRVQMAEGPQPVMSGSVVEFVVERRLVLMFGWEPAPHAPDLPPSSTRMEIDIEPVDSGVRVTLQHTQIPPQLQEETAAGWTDYLQRLGTAASSPAS